MEKNFFQGVVTALATPFKKKGDLDYKALEKSLKFQIDNKVDGILLASTTGESPGLTLKEKMALIIRAVEYSSGKVPLYLATGTNETHESMDLTAMAKDQGASAALIVTPYYNKPTQDGLYEHYRIIAEAVDIPQIIYNVPGRTGVNMEPETVLQLANNCKNIVGIKEASGDLEQIMAIVKNAPKGFNLLTGDDKITLSAMAVGAKGCVSVISNYAPAEFVKLVRHAQNNKFNEAAKIHYKLLELMDLNFVETNPIPVKYALSLKGIMKDVYRMPLFPLTARNKRKLKAELKNQGMI